MRMSLLDRVLVRRVMMREMEVLEVLALVLGLELAGASPYVRRNRKRSSWPSNAGDTRTSPAGAQAAAMSSPPSTTSRRTSFCTTSTRGRPTAGTF